MDIQKLLSTNTSSPLSQILHHTRTPSPSRSAPLAPPQHSVSLADKLESDVDEPLSAATIPASVDPHVAGFLKSALGTRKWRIFSSKLCERKDSMGGSRNNEATNSGGQKGKSKNSSSPSFPEDEDGVLHGGTSPCAIAFLVKVEVVKEVLRNYVPNPYHPLKAESHRYPPAPDGVVHVTRASVLSLCQWSNTQFAYWSRRSEAVSVLACHDSGLRDLFYVLYQRLYQRDPPSHAFSMSSPSTSASWSSVASSAGSPPPIHSSYSQGTQCKSQQQQHQLDAAETERRLRVARSFTGKGLDGLIAEIKKRSGASQFLRGRQSSLDPFGAHLEHDGSSYDPNWPVVMPSVHGKQTHSRNSSDNHDFSMSPLIISSQPTNMQPRHARGSPVASNRYYDETNSARRYETRSAMIMPHHQADGALQQRAPWTRDASRSPPSRTSTAGSKRKRENESSSEDESRYAISHARPRGSEMGNDFPTAYSSSGPKRTRLEH